MQHPTQGVLTRFIDPDATGARLGNLEARDLAEFAEARQVFAAFVDIPVKRKVGESYTGRDAQLDAAAAELLKQSGARTSTQ